jgi:[methyl-Co(III) methanol-specific corrinoid protein]:coenzyme M methyltransferase
VSAPFQRALARLFRPFAKVKPEEAVRIVNNRAALIGNVGVVRPLLQGTPDEVRAAARRDVDAGFNFVSPGCGLAARVPADNIRALVKAVKEY